MDRQRSDHPTRRREADYPLVGEAARDGLTRREREVLRLVVVGQSDREIAAALAIRPRTVEWHVANVLRKLGVGSRTAATAHAIRHGLD